METFVVGLMVVGIGCSKGATDSYKALHTAACAGDKDAFFALVDKPAVRKSFDDLPVAKALTKDQIDKVFDGAMDEWGDDIKKKGKDGDICKWEQIDSTDADVVRVKRVSGGKSRLKFAGGKLVGFQSEDDVNPPAASASGK